jgi:uncharacterized protein DUF350
MLSMQDFNGLLLFAIYFATGVAMLGAFTWLCLRVTPYDEATEISKGHLAPAVALAGAMLGFTFPLLVASYTHSNFLGFLAWGCPRLPRATARLLGPVLVAAAGDRDQQRRRGDLLCRFVCLRRPHQRGVVHSLRANLYRLTRTPSPRPSPSCPQQRLGQRGLIRTEGLPLPITAPQFFRYGRSNLAG